VYDDNDVEVLSYDDMKTLLPSSPLHATYAATLNNLYQAYATAHVDTIPIPQSYKQARSNPHAAKFAEGMDKEMNTSRPQSPPSSFFNSE
jgi:hypothetical protein